jgi:spermidine dehydrogenase
VGGGISGLAAALYYRKAAGNKARILILDNHDDFGGHAKRNEFRAGGRTLLGYGGTYSIESPAPYSAVAKGLIEELGIDVPAFSKYLDRALFNSYGRVPKIFFDKENFGADKLVDDPYPFPGGETYNLAVAGRDAWKQFMAEAPIAEKARKDIWRLCNEKKDYFPRVGEEEKKNRLARMSYAKFLTELGEVHPDVIRLYQTAPQPLFGVGIDAISAFEAWETGYPGFKGMSANAESGQEALSEALKNEREYFFHFPDGNASIARLLVRKLIPAALPGSSAADIATARANYARLDEASGPVRVRLNSTAVKVQHIGDPASAKEVEVTYARGGKAHTVRAANCILACWHAVIPYLCEELPEAQREALSMADKVPLLYTNVVVRNTTAFQKVGANSIYGPGSYYSNMNLDLPVSIGEYQCPQKPDEPAVVHLSKAPCRAGRPPHDQHRIGRMELLGTSFEAIERKTREQLARALGPGGFEPARDILAITANRWPHGYAYEYSMLWDESAGQGGERPCERARKPFGRLAIANADAAAYAYTDAAIDQAYRAVQEITKRG